MTKKALSDYVSIYKEQLDKGDIQIAYRELVKYVFNLRTYLSSSLSYSFGNILQGYMDYTYFYYTNDFLKSKKIRLTIVLNHEKMRFELWLVGQNADIQKKYWNILKSTKWNENQPTMPKYSVLEAILAENPDFNDLESLTRKIEKEAVYQSEKIIDFLKNHSA